MCSWGKFWTKRYKKTKKTPTATSEELGAKAGYCACPLHPAPPKGWAKHLSHPSGLTPGHIPTLTPYKEPACAPAWGAGAPVKPCLNFLTGLLSISIDWGRPRTLVGIGFTVP